MSALLALFTGWRVWLLGAALFAAYSGAIVLRAHHVGYDSGVASDQKKLDAANQTVGSLRAQVASLTAQRDAAYDSVGKVKAQLAANAQADAQAQTQAQAAVKAARADAADADRTLKTWMDKYAAVLHSPACHAALEEICPALRDY